MKIAVIGTGGVGGYFGGRLAEAGNEVWFVARGRHLEEIRRCGLKVKSRLGDILVKPANATDNTKDIGPVDLVIIAVKLWDTDAAIEAAKPMLGPNTAVVSLQNGIEAVERLTAAFGKARVLGGSCQIAAVISGPGIILHTGAMARLTVGELDGKSSARLEALTEACKKAKVDFIASARYRQGDLAEIRVPVVVQRRHDADAPAQGTDHRRSRHTRRCSRRRWRRRSRSPARAASSWPTTSSMR